MDKVVEEIGIKGLVQLRRVSKACKAALNNYSGTYRVKTDIHVSCWDPAKLFAVLPNLACLDIRCFGQSLQIADLAAYTQLSCIEVLSFESGAKRSRNYIDLDLTFGKLPSSLRALRVGQVGLPDSLTQQLQTVQLTDLRLVSSSAFLGSLSTVLRHLSKLQKLHIGSTRDSWGPVGEEATQKIMQALNSLSAMTRLQLETLNPEGFTMLATLRQLHFYNNTLSEAWLNGALTAANHLTLLAIDSCSCEFELGLIPPENLRSLRLTRLRWQFCSYVAGGLQDLSLTDSDYYRYGTLEEYTPAILSLRSLTRLQLSRCSDWTEKDLEAFQQLDIIELAITECKDLHMRLLLPGALQSLQRLHIVADIRLGGSVHFFFPTPQPRSKPHQELLQVWANVLAMPCLRYFSGSCHLFDVGRKQQFELGPKECSPRAEYNWIEEPTAASCRPLYDTLLGRPHNLE